MSYFQESGLYYLQSRYYNPEVGRFLNADAYVSTGQGLLGNNMFAYCGNNPVIHIDPEGLGWVDFWRNVKGWLQQNKEEAKANGNVTETRGVTGNAAFGGAVSGALGITKDRKGNIGIALTINEGGGMPGAGVGAFMTVTNAPNIYKQSGMGTAVGGSVGPHVVVIGAEYNMLIDTGENTTYHGATVSVTAGLYPSPVEFHGEIGNTWVWGINIYDVAIDFVDLLLPH